MPKYERRVLTDKEWDRLVKYQVGQRGWWLGDLEAFRNTKVPVIPDLDAQILDQIERKPRSFDMGVFHGEIYDKDSNVCGTTHCRAGWAEVIAFPRSWRDEGFSVELIGAMVYLVSTGKIPDFFTGDKEALRSIRRAARYQTKGT